MSLSAEIVNPLEQAQWNQLVSSMPDYSFFHSANWARVLHESYGYKPVYCISRNNGNLAAVLPCMEVRSVFTGRRGVSLPFTDYCEPLFTDDAALRDALELLIKHGKGASWDHIEFRGDRYFPRDMPCSCFYLGHIMPLKGDQDSILSGLRDSTSRNIKKALKMGVRAEISTTKEALKEFCRLNCMTRKRHGLPPQPYYFFENIYRHVISDNLGIVVLASFNKQYVSGAVFFHFGNRAFYKYGASDLNYQELRANNLVMWEAVRWYMQKGSETLCFGRTEQESSGLRQYKSGWGAREHTIRYYKYDLGKGRLAGDSSPAKEAYYHIFNVLPAPLSKVAGIMLYRHMG